MADHKTYTNQINTALVAHFGTKAKADKWMKTPNKALDSHMKPEQAVKRGRGAQVLTLAQSL